MQPLARQPSRVSLLVVRQQPEPPESSDDRQAWDFIKQNHNRRLTAETLDIYASYLPWKFVALSTKAAILLEIHHHCLRAKQMLAAPDVRVRLASCCVLGSLARYEHEFLSAVLEQESCGSLVALLRDRDQEVIQWAAYALCCITTFGRALRPLSQLMHWTMFPN
ncbi:hypothetical protein R3P38DRAFT_2994362 [Favolaschia claudopus]|uniref:Uncharacterized protein n=1 Tax=Favolaschia claudopus TaxID=2862362 RepID=A0AAW0ASD6_9AGAR